MELLIVIIAVVLVAVIALMFRTKPNAGGAVEQTPSTQESIPVEEAYIPEELEEYLRELKRNGQPIKAIQKLRNRNELVRSQTICRRHHHLTITECPSRRPNTSRGHSFFLHLNRRPLSAPLPPLRLRIDRASFFISNNIRLTDSAIE